MRFYFLYTLVLAVTLMLPCAAETGTKPDAEGIGLYGSQWKPDPVFEYWEPDSFYLPETELMEGVFRGEECVECHTSLTPGIVTGWKESRHASGSPVVYCDSCHGSDHQALKFPTPETCGNCHSVQHTQFMDEKRYGFPSHALAMDRAVDSKHFVDKPKAETSSCLNCHSVASKCDSCHTRHRFNAAEARRPEACITCHSGPPHPDDETYFTSAHGKIYLADGNDWDWSKPLTKGNYPVPTCAYCHMHGKHLISDKAIWKFGLKEVNPQTAANRVKRAKWVAVCTDCHEAKFAEEKLKEIDIERKQAWKLLYKTEDILKDLRSDNYLSPAAGQRPLYPTDLFDRIRPMERIGFYEGQMAAFYNVSWIERLYFNMWYFDSLGAYKGAAHGSKEFVIEGHRKMNESFEKISKEAGILRTLGDKEKTTGKRFDPGSIWLKGEYTIFNKENN